MAAREASARGNARGGTRARLKLAHRLDDDARWADWCGCASECGPPQDAPLAHRGTSLASDPEANIADTPAVEATPTTSAAPIAVPRARESAPDPPALLLTTNA